MPGNRLPDCRSISFLRDQNKKISVNTGVHQDGLVHISQLSDSFVDDPNTVVKVGQQVWVNVTECDVKRKRIALSMKGGVTVKKPAAKKQETAAYDPNDMKSALAALKGKFGK